ncbi:MAG: hypothetical protein GQ529_08995 [Methyloprofundus sp.]|nr:hypothetical protein [Methyloprofundus sp.]
MYAVEFEAHIENGIVQVPEKYTSLQSVDAKIIILAKETVNNTAFDPSIFLGSAHVSKKEIDTYLNASRDEWQ